MHFDFIGDPTDKGVVDAYYVPFYNILVKLASSGKSPSESQKSKARAQINKLIIRGGPAVKRANAIVEKALIADFGLESDWKLTQP